MYVFYFGWSQPGSDAVKLDRVHGELTRFHDHSKVFDFWDVKLTLFEFQMKVEFSHALENMTGSFFMGFGVRGGNEEVIHIDDEPSLSNHVLEGVVHESLEHSGGVAETEEHDSGLKEPLVGDESHLPLVAVFDVDIVVPPTNVEFSEVASVFQLVHKVGDKRKGVGVMGGVFVEVLVVLAGAELAIFLFNKEERGGLRGVGGTDLSSG